MSPLEVYVWYEADARRDDAVRAAFARLAATMAHGGSDATRERPRLLRRPDLKARDGVPHATWMEVWPAVPARLLPGWLTRLDASAQAEGFGALAPRGRHVEPFEAQAGTPG